MDERVHVTALFRARTNRVDELITILGELAIPSRMESGCVEYGFYQDSEDPTVILATETWRDSAAIASHLNSEHFIDAFGRLGDLLEAKPIIHKCKKVI